MLIKNSHSCPCHSGKPYKNCCQPYHQGLLPKNALLLMRSRYSAYALGLAAYVIETTHSESALYQPDRKQWIKQLNHFSSEVSFNNLEILETQLNDVESYVTFIAYLSKGKADLTFTERSRFLKEGQAWKYIDGKIMQGRGTAAHLSENQSI